MDYDYYDYEYAYAYLSPLPPLSYPSTFTCNNLVSEARFAMAPETRSTDRIGEIERRLDQCSATNSDLKALLVANTTRIVGLEASMNKIDELEAKVNKILAGLAAHGQTSSIPRNELVQLPAPCPVVVSVDSSSVNHASKIVNASLDTESCFVPSKNCQLQDPRSAGS